MGIQLDKKWRRTFGAKRDGVVSGKRLEKTA
jgi:hypothetical protein